MGDANMERARRMDAKLMNMDFDKIPIGQPIDERSLLAAASMKDIPTMTEMMDLHKNNKVAHDSMVQKSWSNHANTLPRVEGEIEPTVYTKPSTPLFPDLTPQRTNIVLQKYKDITSDLKNFKHLPQKTNLEKLQTCFFSDGRAYVSITSFLAFCIIMIIIIVICIGARHP